MCVEYESNGSKTKSHVCQVPKWFRMNVRFTPTEIKFQAKGRENIYQRFQIIKNDIRLTTDKPIIQIS